MLAKAKHTKPLYHSDRFILEGPLWKRKRREKRQKKHRVHGRGLGKQTLRMFFEQLNVFNEDLLSWVRGLLSRPRRLLGAKHLLLSHGRRQGLDWWFAGGWRDEFSVRERTRDGHDWSGRFMYGLDELQLLDCGFWDYGCITLDANFLQRDTFLEFLNGSNWFAACSFFFFLVNIAKHLASFPMRLDGCLRPKAKMQGWCNNCQQGRIVVRVNIGSST